MFVSFSAIFLSFSAKFFSLAPNVGCDFSYDFQTLCKEDLLSSLQAIEQVVGSAPILDSDGSACLFAEISLRSEAQL